MTARTARPGLPLFVGHWDDEVPVGQEVVTVAEVSPYQPGQFYQRELPCLLAVLRGREVEVAVIDGYVTLDAPAWASACLKRWAFP